MYLQLTSATIKSEKPSRASNTLGPESGFEDKYDLAKPIPTPRLQKNKKEEKGGSSMNQYSTPPAKLSNLTDEIDDLLGKLSKLQRKAWKQKQNYFYSSTSGRLLCQWLSNHKYDELAHCRPFIAYCCAIESCIEYIDRTDTENASYYIFGAKSRYQRQVSVRLIASKLFHTRTHSYSVENYDDDIQGQMVLGALYRCFSPILKDLNWIQFEEYEAQVKCRTYNITGLIRAQSQVLRKMANQQRNALNVESYWPEDRIEPDRSRPPSKDREIFHKQRRRFSFTKQFVEKVQNSPYRFAAERWDRQGILDITNYVEKHSSLPRLQKVKNRLVARSKAGEDMSEALRKINWRLQKAREADEMRVRAIFYALDAINLSESGEQYGSQVHIQSNGRIHTNGGPMALPGALRRLYIHPANPDNIFVDVDLVSAQLRLALEFLGLFDVLETVKQIHRDGGDVYQAIAPGTVIPRDVKKILILGSLQCQGASAVGAFVRNELAKQGIDYQLSNAEVEQILTKDPILSPLTRARDEWAEQYTLSKLLATGRAARRTPAILPDRPLGDGTLFRLKQEARDYVESVEMYNRVLKPGRKPRKLKENAIAMRAFSYVLQAMESQIMHTVGAKFSAPIPIAMYDGFMFECSPDDVEARIAELNQLLHDVNPHMDFKTDVLWFPYHQEIEELDPIELIESKAYQQYGDPRAEDMESLAAFLDIGSVTSSVTLTDSVLVNYLL